MKYLNFSELSKQSRDLTKKESANLVKNGLGAWNNIEYGKHPLENPVNKGKIEDKEKRIIRHEKRVEKKKREKKERLEIEKIKKTIKEKKQQQQKEWKKRNYIRKATAIFTNIQNNTNPNTLNKELRRTNISLCNCNKKISFQNDKKEVDITIDDKEQVGIQGLYTCKSYNCPVCAIKRAAENSAIIRKILEEGRKNNRGYQLAVLTIPHYVTDDLKENVNLIIDMCSYILNSRRFKKFKKESGLKFNYSTFELMYSQKNGQDDFNPHKNLIFDYDNKIYQVARKFVKDWHLRNLRDEELEAEFNFYVSDLLVSIGNKFLLKKSKDKRQMFKPYQIQGETELIEDRIIKGGCAVKSRFKDDYATKGCELDKEVSYGAVKNGKESIHPFVLLDLINKDNEEVSQEDKEQYIKAFQKITIATKGIKWFVPSPKAYKFYNELCKIDLKEDLKKERIEYIKSVNTRVICTISQKDWEIFNPTSMRLSELFVLKEKEIIIYIKDEIKKGYEKVSQQYQIKEDKPPPIYEDVRMLSLFDD